MDRAARAVTTIAGMIKVKKTNGKRTAFEGKRKKRNRDGSWFNDSPKSPDGILGVSLQK